MCDVYRYKCIFMAEFLQSAMLNATAEAKATASRAVSALRFAKALPQLEDASQHLLKFVGVDSVGEHASMLMKKMDAIQTPADGSCVVEEHRIPVREELERFEDREVYQDCKLSRRCGIDVSEVAEESPDEHSDDGGGIETMQIDVQSVPSETSQVLPVEEPMQVHTDEDVVVLEPDANGAIGRKRVVLRPYKSRTIENLNKRLLDVKRMLNRMQRHVHAKQLQYNRLESEVQYRILDGKMVDTSEKLSVVS
jgi:hypothetical protein